MNYLFKKGTLIFITVVILFGMLLSVIYQVYFVDSREKRLSNALSNTFIVKHSTPVSNKICDQTTDHGFIKYIFYRYGSGCYFSYENNPNHIEDTINSFIQYGETRIKKQANDSIVRFINKSETLTISYTIDRESGALENGMVNH